MNLNQITFGMTSADSNPPNSSVLDSNPWKTGKIFWGFKFLSFPLRIGNVLEEMLVEYSGIGGMFDLFWWIGDLVNVSVVTSSKVVLKTDPWSVKVLKNSAVLNTEGSGSNDLGAGPNELGVRPNELGAGPNELGVGTSELAAGPNKLGTGPSELVDGPNALGVRPNELGARPNELGAGPNELGAGNDGGPIQEKYKQIKTSITFCKKIGNFRIGCREGRE
jgi:hypothetical protein